LLSLVLVLFMELGTVFEANFVSIPYSVDKFLFNNHPERQALLFSWLLACILTVVYTFYKNRTYISLKNITMYRKFYHLVILFVYIPGMLLDLDLLLLASGAMSIVFLLSTVIEAYKIQPFYQLIHKTVIQFKSSQDTGKFVLTPLYLLLGCSLPIWLDFLKNSSATKPPISSFSGILSVGIGDAAASVIGSKFGRHKVFGTKKSVEGFLASVVFQCFTIFIFQCFNLYNLDCRVFAAIFIVSIAELVTKEIDNLVLPLFMYVMLVRV